MKNRKTMVTTEFPMRTEKGVAPDKPSQKAFVGNNPADPMPPTPRTPRTPTPMESYMSDKNRFAKQGVQEGMEEVAQNFVNERLNSIPFKNSSINVFDKKRYDISREFDGQEVPGSLTVRPTLFGGTVETERFDMPGGGTNMSRVRKNAEGQAVRRIVKDKKINQ